MCFRPYYLFINTLVGAPHRTAPFKQTLTVRGSTGEGRPVTVVEVWVQSVQCGACGARSMLFRREWIMYTWYHPLVRTVFGDDGSDGSKRAPIVVRTVVPVYTAAVLRTSDRSPMPA